MPKHQLISFCLLVLLTFQVLPVSSIGKVLGKSQWTEELPYSADEAGQDDESVGLDSHFLHPQICYAIQPASFSESKALAYIHHSAEMPSNHSADVVSPPPDL